MNICKQRGRNDSFPDEILVWKIGDPVPEWLSDRASIAYIDDVTGNVGLNMTETSTGGYIIKDASGMADLVKLVSREDYVCKSTDNDRIFSLSHIQLGLLYTVPYSCE